MHFLKIGSAGAVKDQHLMVVWSHGLVISLVFGCSIRNGRAACLSSFPKEGRGFGDYFSVPIVRMILRIRIKYFFRETMDSGPRTGRSIRPTRSFLSNPSFFSTVDHFLDPLFSDKELP
jgi:hypothetical protein